MKIETDKIFRNLKQLILGDAFFFSLTRPSEKQMRALFASERRCQGILYCGLTRSACFFLAFFFAVSVFVFLGFLPRNVRPLIPPRPVPPPRNLTEERRRARARIKTSDINPTIEGRSLEKKLTNPCWFEDDARWSPYEDNPYGVLSNSAKKTFDRLQRSWRDRLRRRRREGSGGSLSLRRLRCMPYFYIIGMPKCGTTDFYFKLASHPQIVTGVMKEPHWWTRKRFGVLHPRGVFDRVVAATDVRPATFADYLDIYDPAAEKILQASTTSSSDEARRIKIVGDASVSLMWDNDGWLNYRQWRLEGSSPPSPLIGSHVARLNPDARLIVMLRDPVRRLFSDYLYFRNGENKSAEIFHERVVAAIEIFDNCAKNYSLESCVYAPEINAAGAGRISTPVRLRLGVYHVFLREWLRRFPRRRILIMRLEDYALDVRAATETARRFLGLEADFDNSDRAPEEIVNRRYVNIGPMKTETADALRKFYAPHVEALAELLGDERFLWKDIEEREAKISELRNKSKEIRWKHP